MDQFEWRTPEAIAQAPGVPQNSQARYTQRMPLSPRNPTPAYQRFKQSMIIDYDAWKEGTPYDIAALADVTPDERDLLVEEISERSPLDWRDVEALRALATPKAQQRIRETAAGQADGAGIEAFRDDIETEGWNDAIERRFIDKLEAAASMTGALDRLYDIAEKHPTEAVLRQLFRNARISSDPTVRYSMGAFLLYLSGHVESRYVFDTDHRPHLLDLNSSDYAAYKAAVAWLQDKMANPKT